MKAVVYQENGKIGMEERPVPKLQEESDALVKVTLTSICTSDLHIRNGAVPRAVPGTILGHEFIGIVEKTGTKVKNVRVGQRVAVNVETFCGECFFCRLCHNKQLINSHFYRGVSELPYKLLFAVIYTHLEFRYEVSHTITSHHVHHFHQTRIPDGTLLDYMVQYRKPLFPQFFLYPKKFLPENNPHHKEFHLRPYIQNNANQ